MTAPGLVLEGGDSGRPLYVAGDSAASLMIERVTAENPMERMPADGAPLSAEQIATLRAWIDSGASWGAAATATEAYAPTHWAYQPPVQEAPPPVPFGDWVRNPIDVFVAARMEAAGLAPSPEADKATLLRRVWLDLTGLPPTPEAIADFLADTRPDAYERVVRSLLDSPHYGEKQALHWLDAARYADTNGFEKDRPRSIWPYRDWVIAAFNADMPFDRFVTAQIAGDLLPGATEADHVATGFLRNSMWNEEGGIDVEEFRYEAMVDRTNAVSTVFLGLTMECAQCHTHKYDDLTQREYFQLFAFLNNTDDVEMTLHDPDVAARRAVLEEEIASVIQGLPSRFPAGPAGEAPEDHVETAFRAWLDAQSADAVSWSTAIPLTMHSENRATLTALDDDSIRVSGDWPNTDTYRLEFRTELERITAIRIEAMPDPTLPGGGPGRGVIMGDDGDFLLSRISGETAPWYGDGEAVPLQFGEATESFAGENRAAALALDGQRDTGWGIQGRTGETHWAVFELAEAAEHAGGMTLRLTVDQFFIHQHTLGRFRVWVTDADGPVEAGPLPPALEAIAARPTAERDGDDLAKLRTHFLLTAPELEEEREHIAELKEALPEFPKTLVVQERETPRVTPIYHRGEYLEARDAVQPGVPAVLHPFPEHYPPTRLSFARWLTDAENPLIARVTMNRLWQQYFGKGIVASAEDFGVRGDAPTHPELLDWLAVEFVRRGWRMKEMAEMMVTSATYRQTSVVTPQHEEADPTNDWLARAPRFRVDGELVRDIALASSGALHPVVGGPSIFPPIPDGVLSLTFGGGGDWPESQGAERYRRGLYVHWKRTAPFPGLAVFDAPAGDVACVRRIRSNTPLQALTLLNDQVFLEASGVLARRVLHEGGTTTAQRLRHLFRLTLGRAPHPEERQRMGAFLEAQLARYEADPDSAQALIAATAAKGDESPFPAAETAAWTLLSRAVLNLDETMTRR